MAKGNSTQFERFKAQMAVLVPLVRRLREEFGEAKADALVGEVLDAEARTQGERLAAAGRGNRESIWRGAEVFAAGGAMEFETVSESESEFGFDVRRCSYAEHMEKIGATDLGPLLACGADAPTAEGMGIAFERRQTLITGGSCCDFRYRVDSN